MYIVLGVVLVELLTGQKPICSTRSLEEKSLATHFILSLKETRLFDIIDAQVMKEGGKEEIMAVANLAKRCLNLNGKKRPTMKEVTIELEGIKMSHMPLSVQQNFKEGGSKVVESHMPFSAQQNFQDGECVVELTGPLNGVSTSTSSSLDYARAIPSDDHPLLYNVV
ncbi:hypothetical protein L1049_008989 [Liquidambar formosana]|uniref:Uncharacterized protein n=1 Tax=Liquidambar formosana TaxID=63359 RepID=A0AAP0S3V1_LIQFO